MGNGQSKKPIGKGPPDYPDDFKHEETVVIDLKCESRKGNDYTFRYRKIVVSKSRESLAPTTLEAIQWSGPIPASNIHDVLHIDVWADCIFDITTITTATKFPLYWSFQEGREAIMTVDDRSRMYGELRYENSQGQWVE